MTIAYLKRNVAGQLEWDGQPLTHADLGLVYEELEPRPSGIDPIAFMTICTAIVNKFGLDRTLRKTEYGAIIEWLQNQHWHRWQDARMESKLRHREQHSAENNDARTSGS